MIVSMFSTNLKGFLRYKDTTSPALRARAEGWRKQIILGLPLLMAINDPKFGNSPKVRLDIKSMLNTISNEVISPNVFHRMMKKVITKAAERFQKKIDDGEDKVDESLYRREYHMYESNYFRSAPYTKEKFKGRLLDQYVKLNETFSAPF